MQEGRRMKTSLATYLPLTLLQGFERVVEGLHERGCWRPNINFIFWPHCYDRHVVSLLFSWCSTRGLGVHSIGAFPRDPSVGCGLPYHISSLAVWNSAGNCIGGGSECPLGRVWPSLSHLVSTVWKSAGNCFGGFPRSPSVGCGIPYHISSLTLWESTGNCIGGFRGPPRSGVAFPTTSGVYCLEVCWQLHRGFRGPPRSGVAFPTTSLL